jgi:hypothetical protein
MANAGPGLSPNKQAATGKVSATEPKKIFRSTADGGVNSKSPKAPSRSPGQASKADTQKIGR